MTSAPTAYSTVCACCVLGDILYRLLPASTASVTTTVPIINHKFIFVVNVTILNIILLMIVLKRIIVNHNFKS